MDGSVKDAPKAASQSKVIPRKADVASLPAFVVLHLPELKCLAHSQTSNPL
jgi:hypothetical protein